MSAIELLYRNIPDPSAKNVLVLNAQAHPLLNEICRQAASCQLQQSFKPSCIALSNSGLAWAHSLATDQWFDLILIHPAKNRQQTLFWMADAMNRLVPGGKIVIACANNHGAKGYETALNKLAGNIASSSKSKCRIFSAVKSAALNSELAAQWLRNGEAQRIASHGVISRPGLFSWDRADPGSQLLLSQLPELSGTGMDLCCGYGLLSEKILCSSEQVKRMHLVEAEQLALDCAAENCAQWSARVTLHWLDAAAESLPGNMEWIVCNPPFHTGQDRDIELGQKIILNGCRALKPGGEIYLVANRKLPYESVLQTGLKSVQTLIEAEGFKVIRGVR
ncbi:methyltransferase [Mariprofundus sp. KV]|uniref:methyltransferase n=1 Tax=Mariprofundus sp. KV TaxID=2608715 RepID=UPI0015A12AB9|nr:methyltransferase [Mariprofundus sp. KV]NWF36013.1 class I SAM-dependent methyltransferase [Mariprofundus sp. KV]